MTISRSQDTLAHVRARLVDDLYKVILTFGALSIGSAILRNWLVGIDGNSLVLAATFLIPVAAWLARGRLSATTRGFIALLAMVEGGLHALLHLGVAAPGSFLLPTAVILSWMILETRYAVVTAALALAGFAVCAWIGIHNDPIPGRMGDLNSRPEAWIQLAVGHVLIGALIVTISRRLILTILDREAQTRMEKDRVEGIVEGIQEALFVLRLPEGRTIATNRSAEEMFRVPRERLLASLRYEFSADVPPWTMTEAADRIRRAVDEGPQQFLWHSKRGDGSLFWSEIAMRPLHLEGQTQLLITVRDIDDRIRDKLEVERLNAELEARVARRTAAIEASRQDLQAFAYAVSHDLRAPLRAIDGFARALAEDHAASLPPDAVVSLDRIQAGAGRMNRLIDALFDLSRIDRKPVRRISVDMAALVREVREECAASAPANSPPMDWSVDSLPRCETDPDLVRQIWANLLGNAIKFSHSVPSPRLVVSAEERPDGIWYSVRDNGEGFDMKHSGHLFGMFQRLHGNQVDGLGIGLATVKRILKRLGGEIEFESAPGQGATFRFRPRPSRWDEGLDDPTLAG